MSSKADIFEIWKPKCSGCIYQGTTLPCEYILITGKSPKSQGAHIDSEGKGGCELYTAGEKAPRNRSLVITDKSRPFTAEAKTRNKPSRLDAPEFFEMHRNGASDQEIADEACVARGTVKKWRRRHGLASNRPVGTAATYDYATIEKLYNEGLSDPEIHRQTGIPVSAVFYWRKSRGLASNRANRIEREKRALHV